MDVQTLLESVLGGDRPKHIGGLRQRFVVGLAGVKTSNEASGLCDRSPSSHRACGLFARFWRSDICCNTARQDPFQLLIMLGICMHMINFDYAKA